MQPSHGCGGVAAGVARDFFNVHGHFLIVGGDFPDVTGDFLTVNPDFRAACGGRSNVDAGCAIVGGDCTVASGDGLNVNLDFAVARGEGNFRCRGRVLFRLSARTILVKTFERVRRKF